MQSRTLIKWHYSTILFFTQACFLQHGVMTGQGSAKPSQQQGHVVPVHFNLFYSLHYFLSVHCQKRIFFTFLDRCLRDPSVPFLAWFLRLYLNVAISLRNFWFHASFSCVSVTTTVLLKTQSAFCLSFLITETASWHGFFSTLFIQELCRNIVSLQKWNQYMYVFMYNDNLYPWVFK